MVNQKISWQLALSWILLLIVSGYAHAASVPSAPSNIKVYGKSAPFYVKANSNYYISWSASPTPGVTYELVGERSGLLQGGFTSTRSPSPRNKPAGVYYYKVRACNSAGCSAYSPTSSAVTVFEEPGIPPSISAPSKATANQSYTVSWGKASGYVQRYELVGELSSTIATTSSAKRSATRNKPPGTYYYKVRACNDYGCSNYSSKTSGTTVGAAPGVPSSITAPTTATENKDYTVSWGASSGSVKRYELVGELSSTIATTTSSKRSAIRNKPRGKYYYKVRACNDFGCSNYTSTTSGTTVGAANIPPVPNAGPSMRVQEARDITVYGSATDSDGEITSYAWYQISGPALLDWKDKDKPVTSFKTPEINEDTSIRLRLWVTDNEGAQYSDDMIVYLNDRADVTITFPPHNDYKFATDEEIRFSGTDIRDNGDNVVDVRTNIYELSPYQALFNWQSATFNAAAGEANFTYNESVR